jgi:hypothetical protein
MCIVSSEQVRVAVGVKLGQAAPAAPEVKLAEPVFAYDSVTAPAAPMDSE